MRKIIRWMNGKDRKIGGLGKYMSAFLVPRRNREVYTYSVGIAPLHGDFFFPPQDFFFCEAYSPSKCSGHNDY